MKSRRAFMAGAAVVSILPLASARATPVTMAAAIKQVTGDGTVRAGRVTLDIPPLVENGNAVPLTVTVESPMTEADHVRAIHVFSERNPEPVIMSFKLGPRAGRASVATRVRLADTQTLVAIAEMSDGTYWAGSAPTVVTIAACLEDI